MSTAINAPKVSEHFRSLYQGGFMCRILNVCRAWFASHGDTGVPKGVMSALY